MQTLAVKITTPTHTRRGSRVGQFLKNLLLTLLLLALAIGLVQGLSALGFEAAELILVYTLFVVIISRATPGYFLGVLATGVSAWAYAFFTIPPTYTFQFSYKFTLTVSIMLFVTLVTSLITTRMKNQTALAIQREQRTELLFAINQELLAARELSTIVAITNQLLVSHLQRSVVFYLGHPQQEKDCYFSPFPKDVGIEYFDTRPELRLATSAFVTQKMSGYSTLNPMDSFMTYLPVVYGDRALAVLGLSCMHKALTPEDQNFLQLLMAQVALALELQRLSDDQNTVRTEAEKEKMRSSLLRAISHDLRTPLTSILGASNTMLESDSLDEKTKHELLTNINQGAEWLIRMVENLLSVTRLADDTLKLDKTPEAAEEVIGQATAIIRGRFPDASIHVKVPEGLLLVPMDATLISQVLINLLENAVKNSGPDDLVLVNLKKDEHSALFEVSDNGRGISEELLEGLFEMQPAGTIRSADSAQGLGIGLSICDTIIRAHGGEIEGRNKESGGAIFSFWLPLEKEENSHES